MTGMQSEGNDRQKASRALKTISEASELIDVPQHVLRFWETKFPQIKPLKRNGGRRFYRPDDIDTLLKIKFLLYKQGYTIKGAKKLFEQKNSAELLEQLDEVRQAANIASNDNHPLAADGADNTSDMKIIASRLRQLSSELRALNHAGATQPR